MEHFVVVLVHGKDGKLKESLEGGSSTCTEPVSDFRRQLIDDMNVQNDILDLSRLGVEQFTDLACAVRESWRWTSARPG